MPVAARALLVLLLALAGCRGGVKAGLAQRAGSPAGAAPAEGPPAPAPTVAESPTRRIEYYKISDG